MMVSGIAAAGSWLQESCFQDLSFQELGFQTLTAALGSLAFGIVYKVRNERLPVVAAGGGIGWFLYSVIFCRWESIFISNMAASVFATLYSEAMARKRKAPVVVFLLPCLIPLVPGGGLRYCGRSDTGFGSGTPSDAGPVNRSAAPEKGRMRGEEDESKI